MELDLATGEWRRLSGYVMPPAKGDYSCPGPRVSPSSWVEKGRFWLLMGQCDREGARLTGELHGAHIGFPYSDMWSWDIEGEKWRRERVAGNPPSSRAEMACTYVRPSQLILLPSLDIIFPEPKSQKGDRIWRLLCEYPHHLP